MTRQELEKAREAFKQGRMSASNYWGCYAAYWSQFKSKDKEGGEK